MICVILIGRNDISETLICADVLGKLRLVMPPANTGRLWKEQLVDRQSLGRLGDSPH